MSLTLKVKWLHTGRYRMLLKDTKKDTHKWKDIPCLYFGRPNIVKLLITQSYLYIHCNLHQNSTSYFYRNEKNILKYIRSIKEP
jgi:hypothetical protein